MLILSAPNEAQSSREISETLAEELASRYPQEQLARLLDNREITASARACCPTSGITFNVLPF